MTVGGLVALFACFERIGQWCSVLDLVLIVLLPKLEGGLRPIGLFPTLVRVWMRAPKYQVKQRERERENPKRPHKHM